MDRVRGWFVAVALVAAAAPALPVRASDHEPPPSFAIGADGGEQKGRMLSTCWIRRTDTDFTRECTSPPLSFPVSRSMKGTVSVIVRKETPPERLVVHEWQRLNHGGGLRGEGRTVEVRLYPSYRQESLVWEAQLDLADWPRHFVLVFAEWRDEDGCLSCPLQSVVWSFNMKTGA